MIIGNQTILKGHTSPETAYVVNDYPYGYTLRCMIRYWLEFKPKHGVRLMSQTTNPKRPGEQWNKPKGSTYSRFGGCMYLDHQGHVKWSGLSEYSDGAEAKAWSDRYREGVPPEAVPGLDAWVRTKLAYDAARAARPEAAAKDLTVGVTEALKAFVAK
jgi:hypothetical protein